MVTQSDYEYVQEHPEARQDFVNSIDFEEVKPFVKGVTYKKRDSPLVQIAGPMRSNLPLLTRLGIPGGKTTIIVYPFAFHSCHLVLGDFLSSLIDHEGEHAHQHFIDPKKSHPRLAHLPLLVASYFSEEHKRELTRLMAGFEYKCTANQVKNLDRRGCSEPYREATLKVHKFYADLIGES